MNKKILPSTRNIFAVCFDLWLACSKDSLHLEHSRHNFLQTFGKKFLIVFQAIFLCSWPTSKFIPGICGMLFISGCSTLVPLVLQRLDAPVCQAILVHPVKKGSIQARLSVWQKEVSKPKQGTGNTGWRRVFLGSAVIGRNGLAAAGEKEEGDGKTPSGIYPLGPAFGYASSVNTGLLYRQAKDNDFWVDDVKSLQYNQWVNGSPAANSFERMKRRDNLYQFGIVIGYNTHPVIPGAGSAIFVHIWRGYNSPTSGCVALNQRSLRKILRWLGQQYQPVIILE
jgi:L,D-peptidoglycan transpeptidase YkuD (ErfK/YbiS/YcfS/YnhG family)